MTTPVDGPDDQPQDQQQDQPQDQPQDQVYDAAAPDPTPPPASPVAPPSAPPSTTGWVTEPAIPLATPPAPPVAPTPPDEPAGPTTGATPAVAVPATERQADPVPDVDVPAREEAVARETAQAPVPEVAAEVTPEPVDAEPVDTEPVDAEPVGIEPMDTEPVDSGPVGTQPADTEAVPDAAPLDVPEPAPADWPSDGGAPGVLVPARAGRSAALVIAATLAALSVLVLAGTAVFTRVVASPVAHRDDARDDALRTARDAARLLLAYDYRRLDQDFQAGAALTADPFKSEYERTTTRLVRDVATQYKAVVRAEVVQAGAVEVAEDRVVALLFVNQTTTSTRVQGAKVDLSRVRMVLERRDGRWLVTGVKAL